MSDTTETADLMLQQAAKIMLDNAFTMEEFTRVFWGPTFIEEGVGTHYLTGVITQMPGESVAEALRKAADTWEEKWSGSTSQ